MEILLNSFKNINSVNVDNYSKIELVNKVSEINEYDIRNVLSATEIFDAEREANEVYRIYGKIEYLSLLNGLKNDYSKFEDFFKPQFSGNSKNVLNSFDFYLVKAGTGYTPIVGNNIEFIRYFEIIATPNNFEIYPAGFSNNVFGEQAYAYNFNVDFNVSTYLDNFNFPATELFLYAQYKPTIFLPNPPEQMLATTWTSNGIVFKTSFSPIPPNMPISLGVGDYIKSYNSTLKIGDLIEYSKSEFLQVQHTPQTFYITTIYTGGYLQWKYNPFIPLRLRYFADELNQVNTGSTSYDATTSIPYYATKLPNTNNYVWRDILPQGFTDPTTNLGVDYPFVNKCRYLFSNIILDITPDLNDTNTLHAFENVWFSRNATKINVKPLGNINDIGKPC